MARGSPDNQHELIVTDLTRCLKEAYPSATLTRGTMVADLHLKRDVFVEHPDGRHWAYEVINKNRGVGEVEAKHQKYTDSGISVYWILWETLGPEKPLDAEKIATQSVWVDEKLVDQPRHYRLNKLQKTLARLGDGSLYVFSPHKPFLDQIDHWLLKLMLVGLEVYHFPLEQLTSRTWLEGEDELIPLPYLVFDEQGRPQLRPGALDVSPYLAPLLESAIQIPTNKPIFISEPLSNLDNLVQSDALKNIITQGSEQALQDWAIEYSPEEVARFNEQVKIRNQQLQQQQAHLTEIEDPVEVLQMLNEYVDSLPPLFRDVFKETLPFPSEEVLRQLIELKTWFDDDPHLQALLAEI